MPIKINKNSIIIIVAVVALLGVITLGYLYNKKQEADNIQQTAEKAIDFVNKNLLSGGSTASLDGATSSGGVLAIGLKIGEQTYTSYVTKDGKMFFPEGYEIKEATTTSETSASVGNFMTKDEEVCKEDGKPIIYFFGSNTCPHCLWEHPILEKVLKNFEGQISFHNNMDSQADLEIFSKYSDGGIPTLVFGCKYYRLGSGESDGEEAETKNLTAMLCKLTDNKPSEICSGVQDLVNQIQ
ncbi:MAG: hypothetical protein NTZ84_00805 [Candidatus Nealsonbacteria bacterium]|nr:hypothetical protein [Candidatus Nealsonbacteria bacterium]